MRAIVTGGAGFIGSHVVDALVARGDEVAVVDSLVHGTEENVSAGAELHVRDIREPLDDLFDAVRPEVVFHLAAQADVRVSVEHPVDDAAVNVLGTVRILEAARRHGAQVVFASTGGAIYGECEEPAREDSPSEPLSPYGTAKLAAEEYLRAYNRLYGTRHVALRYGNVYGPRQDPHGEAGVVAIFLGALARGEQARIFGDGAADARLRLRRRRRARDDLHGRPGPRRLQRRHRARDLRRRALRAVRARRRLGPTAEHAPARLGELQRSFLDPELAAQRARLHARWSSSRTACARPGTGFRRAAGRAAYRDRSRTESGLRARMDRRNSRTGETIVRGSSAPHRRARPPLAHRRVRRGRGRRRRAPPAPRHRRREARGLRRGSDRARGAGAGARAAEAAASEAGDAQARRPQPSRSARARRRSSSC